jgi:hypothetical protein
MVTHHHHHHHHDNEQQAQKWMLVNLQDHENFASHRLNRDVWYARVAFGVGWWVWMWAVDVGKEGGCSVQKLAAACVPRVRIQ